MALYPHKYNLRLNTKLEDYNLELYAFRIGHKAEDGGLGRYWHLKKAMSMITPGIQNHDWSDRQYRSLCDDSLAHQVGNTIHRYVRWIGCASCVAGTTKIFNPITGEDPTIENLYQLQIKPTVQTLIGPIEARVPFVKGYEELYLIRLEDGSEFKATSEHRLLKSDGSYCRVADLKIGQSLLSFDQCHLQSNVASCPLVHGEDALCFPKRAEDYLDDYCAGFRLDDERLHWATNIDQSFFPSSICEVARSHFYSYVDDHEPGRKCIHPSLHGDHHARSEIENRHNLSYTASSHDCGQERSEHGENLCEFCALSHSGILRSFPFVELAHDFSRTRSWRAFQPKVQGATYTEDGIIQVHVASICKTEPELFYDLHVPIANHYYAEGAIHHNSGKTFTAGRYAFHWWLAAPNASIVILTSTTKEMIRRRIWPVIQQMYFDTKEVIGKRHGISSDDVNIGHLIDSKTTLQCQKGDDKHAIFAIAVAYGETNSAVARIQGQHAQRILLIIDEATDTPEAIYKTIPNLRKGCQDLVVLAIGNPISRYTDPFAKVCEPLDGWPSVNPRTIDWTGRACQEVCFEQGPVIHFFGPDSPNVRAHKTIFPFLYTWEDHQMCIKGEAENTVEYWKWVMGFPPPEGVVDTVLSETMIEKYDARGKHQWHQRSFLISFLDPAFGGDKCLQKFAQLGDINGGASMGLTITETIEIKVKALSPHERDYQIARSAIDNCRVKGVTPEHFGVDSTGTGRGVYAIIAEEWSPLIARVEFGGLPSDMIASEEDNKPAKEVYDLKVCELWFSVRDFVRRGALKGMTSQEILEFCTRTYKMKARKYSLEPKDDYRAKFSHSPDDADCVAGLVEVARRLGATPVGRHSTSKAQSWKKAAQSYDQLYVPDGPGEEDKEPELFFDAS